MIIPKKITGFLLICVAVVVSLSAYAQGPDSLGKSVKIDSAKLNFVAKMQAFARRSSISSAREFAADKASINQIKTFEEIKGTVQKAKTYLKGNLDTPGTKMELQLIEADFISAGDGVFTNKGTSQTFRNLTATSKIIGELLKQSKARKPRLDLRLDELNNFRYQLDSLKAFKTNNIAIPFPQQDIYLHQV